MSAKTKTKKSTKAKTSPVDLRNEHRESGEKLMSIILSLIKLCMFILSCLFLLRQFTDPEYNELGGILGSFILPYLTMLYPLVFKKKLSIRTEFVYLSFIFAAVFLGTCSHWYIQFPIFDKIVHFSFGVLAAIIGYYALQYFGARYADKRFRAIFIVCFALALGAIWEIYEFTADRVLHMDMQHVLETGVGDTMGDLIVTFLGSILGGILFVHKMPCQLLAPEEIVSHAKKEEQDTKD